MCVLFFDVIELVDVVLFLQERKIERNIVEETVFPEYEGLFIFDSFQFVSSVKK